jgi:hypothetical protein
MVKITQNIEYLNDVYLFRIVDQGEAKGRNHPQANSEAMRLSGGLWEYRRQEAYCSSGLVSLSYSKLQLCLVVPALIAKP